MILVDHLRTHITDPRGRDTNTGTESAAATASQTTFSITVPSSNHLSCVTEVRVDASVQSKWLDYYIDHQNKQVVFYTALSGGESVEIDYKYGTRLWIHPDRPSTDDTNKVLTDAEEWPRISVILSGGTGQPLARRGGDTEDSLLILVEVRAKEKYRPTIDGVTYDAQGLTKYLPIK